MSNLSNKARVHKLALEYVNNIAISHAQTVANLGILQTIAEAFISSVGIDFAEQYLDIDKATGKWLDDIAKTVGVSRNDLQGIPQQNDDAFFRIYIRFTIIRNFSRASLLSLSQMLFVLFGDSVYITRQSTPFSIGIFANSENYDTVKILLDRGLIPLAICHSAKLLVKAPPDGYKWWGFFSIPYSVVIEGKMSNEKYNELLASQENTHWQPQNNNIKYLYIPEEFIYRP
jgi:hypothetical protein